MKEVSPLIVIVVIFIFDAYLHLFSVGFGREYGTVFATPRIAEKGYMNVRVDVATSVGYSSIPPDHTASVSPVHHHLIVELLPAYWYSRHNDDGVRTESFYIPFREY